MLYAALPLDSLSITTRITRYTAPSSSHVNSLVPTLQPLVDGIDVLPILHVNLEIGRLARVDFARTVRASHISA